MPTPTPAVQLLLDSSGPDPNQAVALDSELFLRDPFTLVDAGSLLNQGTDRNTRVMIFVAGIQLLPADTIVVNLVDNQNQTYDVTPENVRLVPDRTFTKLCLDYLTTCRPVHA